MSRRDLDRETLYLGVKQLIETESKHIQLPQQKLFTLFSIAFQYFLFNSSRDPGHYIIRIDDSFLAEKLARKAKDDITRKMMQKLYLPRRIKYEASHFHLDFFNFQSWALTNELPKDRIKGALIVKNTQPTPLTTPDIEEIEAEDADFLKDIPKDLFLTSLTSFVPKTITIAYDENFDGLEKIKFDFIQEEQERLVSGVRIAGDIDLSDIDD